MKKIRLLLIEDNHLLRGGIFSILKSCKFKTVKNKSNTNKKGIAMKKDTGLRFITSLIGLLLILTMSPSLIAQDVQDDEAVSQDSSVLRAYKRLPILNGFRFIPSDVVPDPFISTFIKLNVGTGTVFDLNSYVKNLKGNVIDTLSGDLTYMSGEAQFQLAVNDWLAFSASAGGTGRLGTNAYTLLSSGISYGSGFTLGSKIRIWQNDKMYLAGSLEYSSTTSYLFSIYDFVKEVYETGSIDTSANNLVTEDVLARGFANINYAYAPADWFGFVGLAGWGVGTIFNGAEKGIVRLGAAASVDFLNVDHINFPVGLQVSFRYNSLSENGEDITNMITLGLRIGYTGHKDFDIGIENTYRSVNYNSRDETNKLLTTAVKLRYYF
jgi:hypothetical protein